MPDRASGFCVYNDVAVAIRWLLDQGAERVAYVDVDVHHGDGVEEVFWDDPRVLTISLHETGQMLFPGTGLPHRHRRARGAEGSAVNVALPPGTADAGWLRAFHAVVPPLLREFAPEVLVTQHGCDSHTRRPAGPPDADRRRPARGLPRRCTTSPTRSCEGRWVATGGGGYAVVDVVPRAWTHLLGDRRPGARSTATSTTPEEWRGLVARACWARRRRCG